MVGGQGQTERWRTVTFHPGLVGVPFHFVFWQLTITISVLTLLPKRLQSTTIATPFELVVTLWCTSSCFDARMHSAPQQQHPRGGSWKIFPFLPNTPTQFGGLFCSIHCCGDGKGSGFYLRSPDCILLGAGLESSSIYLDWLFLPWSSTAASDSMTCAENATSEMMISSIALVASLWKNSKKSNFLKR